MRTFTNNKELVRPAITPFATSFISLHSLLNFMWDVKRGRGHMKASFIPGKIMGGSAGGV